MRKRSREEDICKIVTDPKLRNLNFLMLSLLSESPFYDIDPLFTNARSSISLNQELEMMRKSKRDQKEFFQKLERGEFDESNDKPKEPKLLARKIKDLVRYSECKLS